MTNKERLLRSFEIEPNPNKKTFEQYCKETHFFYLRMSNRLGIKPLAFNEWLNQPTQTHN